MAVCGHVWPRGTHVRVFACCVAWFCAPCLDSKGGGRLRLVGRTRAITWCDPSNTNHTPAHGTAHNATQHNTTQRHTTQHNATQALHNKTQHNTPQHNTTPHKHATTLHNTQRAPVEHAARQAAAAVREPPLLCGGGQRGAVCCAPRGRVLQRLAGGDARAADRPGPRTFAFPPCGRPRVVWVAVVRVPAAVSSGTEKIPDMSLLILGCSGGLR